MPLPANARVVVGPDGKHRVLLDLADLQALIDAAAANDHGLPDVDLIIRELRAALESDEGTIPLDQFLAEYDAVHGERLSFARQVPARVAR